MKKLRNLANEKGKSKTFLTMILIVICLSPRVKLNAQDILVYTEGSFQGSPIQLKIGQSYELPNLVNNISFKRYNAKAAILVESVDPVDNDVENWEGIYDRIFFYSEENKRTGIGGTDQYQKSKLRISCVEAKLPKPEIYIPIDRSKVHPESGGFPFDVKYDTEMLFLKRAYFWENSEDLRCNLDFNPLGESESPHGPTGDIKIQVCHKSALKYSLDSLNEFHHLWNIGSGGCKVNVSKQGLVSNDCGSRFLKYKPQNFLKYYNISFGKDTVINLLQNVYAGNTIFGPDYISPSACNGKFIGGAPIPHNEWIDGHWGVYYSNVAIIDWDKITEDTVALIITEADVPWDYVVASSDNLEDIMGVVRVVRGQKEPIIFKVGMFGWLILKNETLEKPINVEKIVHYWYPVWDGNIPELVLGPEALIKHFEEEQYTCYDIDSKCAASAFSYVKASQIIRMHIDTVARDTFSTYLFDFKNTKTLSPEVNFISAKISDTLIVYNYPFLTSNFLRIDTITPSQLFRLKGSQYRPYNKLEQIKRYVHDGEIIGLIGGIIPPGNNLTKRMTLIPSDEERKADEEILDKFSSPGFTKIEFHEPSSLNSLNFKVYPNPALGELFVNLHFTQSSNVNVFIVNSLGQMQISLLSNQQIEAGEHQFKEQIGGRLKSGVYFIVVKTDSGISAQKIVIR